MAEEGDLRPVEDPLVLILGHTKEAPVVLCKARRPAPVLHPLPVSDGSLKGPFVLRTPAGGSCGSQALPERPMHEAMRIIHATEVREFLKNPPVSPPLD